MAYEIISKTYYSNCFIEAIKEKIRNFKTTKIKFIPKKLNCENNPHFYWIDKKDNYIKEFSSIGLEKKSLLYPFFFKGHVVKFSKERNTSLLNMGIDKVIKNIEERYEFTSRVSKIKENENIYSWKIYSEELDASVFTKNNPFPYVLGCYMENESVMVKIYQIDKDKGIINPNNDKIKYYKIISEYSPL